MLPDLSVLWVIVFVLLLTALLNRLLFRPLIRVMHMRKGAITSARELAQASAEQARTALAEVEAQTVAARTEVYREMEEARRRALERRAGLVAKTRQEAEASLADATARLAAQAAEARARLERDTHSLAGAIVERVLGRNLQDPGTAR